MTTQWVYWNDQTPAAEGFYWLFNPAKPPMTPDNPEIIQVVSTPDGPALRSIGDEGVYSIGPGLVAYWTPVAAPPAEIVLWKRKAVHS